MAKLNYWQKRYLQEKDRQLTNTAEYEAAMQARLKLVEQDLEKEVDYWIKRYTDNQDTTVKEARKILKTIGTRDWHMTLKEFEAKAKQGGFDKELDAEYFRSQLSRLENINAQLVNLLYSTAQDEAGRLEEGLTNQFQDTYMHTLYNTQVQQAKLSSDFANVNETQAKIIVNESWQGSSFSKRVWHNYTEVLPNELTDALLRGTVLGHSEQQIFKMFRQRFKDVEDFQLHRLIITEMGHVAEQATAKGYEESGIEQYQYLATLESHTCEECAHLDGRIFSLKERKDGINYPLIHPYCRCTTMPYLNDLPDVKDRWARDPETGKGKYVDNMTFDKWLNTVKDKQKPQLSDNELWSLRSYVSPDSYVLNEKLRTGVELTDTQKKMVNYLDTALDKLPKYHSDKPLQRSITFWNEDDLKEYLQKIEVGKIVRKKSYTSSSKKVYNPDAEVQIIIKNSKSGADLAGYGLDAEREVLFERGTRFKITNRYRKDDKDYIEVSEDE